MHLVSYVPSIAMIFLTIVFFIVVVGLGMLVGKNDKRFSLMILLCVPVVAAFVYFRSQAVNHHSYVSVVEQAGTEPLINQPVHETARQTAIRTRIEILEKELVSELEQDRETSEAGQKSKKPKPSPGEAAVADKKEKEATSKQREEKKQLLEKAKQELKREKEKSPIKPRWLTKYPVIEKKNWQEYLAHPEKIPNQFIVSSGRFTTVGEARSIANRLAKVTISAKLKSLTGHQDVHYNESWYQSTLSRTYDEKLQVKILDASPTTMHREHLLIDLNQEKMAALLPELRKTVVEKRIYTAASGLLGIILVSGLLSVVLSRHKE